MKEAQAADEVDMPGRTHRIADRMDSGDVAAGFAQMRVIPRYPDRRVRRHMWREGRTQRLAQHRNEKPPCLPRTAGKEPVIRRPVTLVAPERGDDARNHASAQGKRLPHGHTPCPQGRALLAKSLAQLSQQREGDKR